ncbi:hypothetical protein KIW84_024269 [Lathyrus oleraceus]|uniref:Uncharacterized protein n=1 Tax=Pisum sativum TaxID=3888 RepID=A0A9D4YJQ9_PEA|nr:hypothetical protein KIW84_024269 [Pisum sativum]
MGLQRSLTKESLMIRTMLGLLYFPSLPSSGKGGRIQNIKDRINFQRLCGRFAQASVGDLSVGLYAWSRNLLLIVVSKSGNPQSRDLTVSVTAKLRKMDLAVPLPWDVLINYSCLKIQCSLLPVQRHAVQSSGRLIKLLQRLLSD